MTQFYRSRRRSRRASILIQALVASAILVTTLAGITSMWYICFSLTSKSDQVGMAYTVGRRKLEELKQTGYSSGGYHLTADATAVYYYDQYGNDVTGGAGSQVFTLTTVLSTTNGLQTGTVTVTLTGSTAVLYKFSTYLVNYGV